MTEETIVQVRALRENLRDTLDSVMFGRRVVITRNRKEVAVMVPPDWYRRAVEAMQRASNES